MTPDHADTAPAYPSHSGQFADMLNARCNLHSAHNSLVLWSAHKLAGRDMDAEEEARAARDAVRRAAKCLADTAPAMPVSDNDLARAQLHAQDVANALSSAYWLDSPNRKDNQMNMATDALLRLAEKLGYRLVKEGDE